MAGYVVWVREWHRHPRFDWALIPDAITGGEAENEALLAAWPADLRPAGVPVWHLHESPTRLDRLVRDWPRVALGSSGQWATPGTAPWRRRMGQALAVACDAEGRPRIKLHGLRMLDPRLFTRLPLASADSTNAATNSDRLSRFGGCYVPPSRAARATVIADRVEAHQSAAVWRDGQSKLELHA